MALYSTINGLISQTKTNMLPEDKDNQEQIISPSTSTQI